MTSLLEPAQLPRLALDLLQAGKRFAVATVLKADGHTPVNAGATAIMEADGTFHGTVGGGALEAEAQRRALSAIQSGQPEVFDFELLGDDPAEALPICGGKLRLLIDPTPERAKAAYAQAAAALKERQRGVWLISLKAGNTLETTAHYLWIENASCSSRRKEAPILLPFKSEPPYVGCYEVQAALPRCLDSGDAQLVTGDTTGDHFLLPLLPRPILLVVGGGHVGKAVVAQASLVGFDITVLEDRPEFADPNRFPPGTLTRCGNVAQALADFPIGRDTFIVLMTRGHRQDAEALAACIRRPAAYIGMIGSRRKVPLLRRQFIESGWATAEEFDRVYAPIGLDLGAVTVPEIATEVVAQLVAVRRKGSAPRI